MRAYLLLALLASGLAGPAGAGTLYVSNERDNSLTLIDTDTLTVKSTIKVGARPCPMV